MNFLETCGPVPPETLQRDNIGDFSASVLFCFIMAFYKASVLIVFSVQPKELTGQQ